MRRHPSSARFRGKPRRPRPGFTLVELLVAIALIVFIMVILTEAFSAGTGVFRTLKAQGDLMEKLRAAELLLRDSQNRRERRCPELRP